MIGVGGGVASDCPVDTWRGDVIGEALPDPDNPNSITNN